MGSLLLVLPKIALRAPSTRASLIRIESKLTHTEGRTAFVGDLVVRFEACVRIAADFPQQWPQSDFFRRHPRVYSDGHQCQQ